jgi:hypothetical protein
MAGAVGGISASAVTQDFDFTGTFSHDNDIARFYFSVGADSTIKVFSSSWVQGGFDPILAIWNASGQLLAQQDDGGNTGSTMSGGTSYAHGDWDSYYSVYLTAGTYSATIGQYDNFAVGLNITQGFTYDANPTFTYNYSGHYAPYFNSVDGTVDTGNYAFHILNVESASGGTVPDAACTLSLLSLAFAGLAAVRHRL